MTKDFDLLRKHRVKDGFVVKNEEEMKELTAAIKSIFEQNAPYYLDVISLEEK